MRYKCGSVAGVAADWDPVQYERFKEQRAQPFWDLVDLVRTDGPASAAVSISVVAPAS